MAFKVKFDSNYNPEIPSIVLATKGGKRLGLLPVNNLQFTDFMNSANELRFSVNKEDIISQEAQTEKIKIDGFGLSSILTSNTGSVRIGQIEEKKYTELYRYFDMSAQLEDAVIKLTKDGGTQQITGLGFQIDNTTLIITKDDVHVIEISNAGYVYLYNPSTYDFDTDDYIYADFTFYVQSATIKSKLWEDLKDFKLAWAKEWNRLFEIKLDLNDNEESLSKDITATALGEAELSQIKLYNIEINTETDIDREDYEPTVIWNPENPSCSLLHRLLAKAPHYTVTHIDTSIKSIQRTFAFNDISIYDAFQEVAKDIDCIFLIDCYYDEDMNIVRSVKVYDLKSYCVECGTRGDFDTLCSECGSNNIIRGYGEDTNVFITSENLAESITYTTDTGSVKNCFKLEAGDDYMTAAISSCNPNGSQYIWNINDETKEDMSSELRGKLAEYDELYSYYQNEYPAEIDASLKAAYNELIQKYQSYNSDLIAMPDSVIGYPALMEQYYNSIDFYWFLKDGLMPSVEIARTTAALEAAKLNYASLSPVAVQDLSKASSASTTNAVVQMARTIVSPNYQVKAIDTYFNEGYWYGKFVVTNYSDEDDVTTTAQVSVLINENYEKFVEQKIKKILNSQSEEIIDIVSLFALSDTNFAVELKKYCLEQLLIFQSACQSCLDVMIEQGFADKEKWDSDSARNGVNNLYISTYSPYYSKLLLINEEIELRESEINTVYGAYNTNGEVVTDGLQSVLVNQQETIHDALNFEAYLGETLWKEFSSFRREDTYSNPNFISDGLNSAEVISNALEFIKLAQEEIFKSANLQHSITSTLKNLLAIKEFQPLAENFKVGNWLRIKLDGVIYKLRLIEFKIDYENLDEIVVKFSDVKKAANGLTDLESVINSAKNMGTSYESVKKQASQGKNGNEKLRDWVNNGLSLTTMKIVDKADNQNISWDSHGFLCKEYLPIEDDYDDRQLKIINRGLYVTDDNWRSSKAGVGNFLFYNPMSGNMEEAYGVIADTLVGNLILSERVGIYNMQKSIVLDENGVTITTTDDGTDQEDTRTFLIQKKWTDTDDNEVYTKLLYVDNNGNLVLNGSISINSAIDGSVMTLDQLSDTSRFTDEIARSIDDVLNNNPETTWVFVTDDSGNIVFDANGNATTQQLSVSGLYSKIDAQYRNSVAYTQYMLNRYQSEVSQYLTFNSETGLTLGATNSAFKTVIDNTRLAFLDGNTVAAYISNNQLFIPNAVIQNTLTLGGFFFSPRSDGGVSLTWQGI